MKEKVVGYLQALCWVRMLLAKARNKEDPREVLRKLAAEVDSALETITSGAGADFKQDVKAEVQKE